MATGSDRSETDFPRAIGAPATRALASAGYARLDQLARVPAAGPAALHGVGPKALRVLGEALAEHGLSLR
ncbi:DNA-binding protein [Streptomyces sp. c-19]|uniref:DNA-binding protein n=1 Tax=Streptomyces sp. c-19 TaxID=2789275 RepID=UPI0039806949